MHDQVGQNGFENSDKDQIMQRDDLDYSSVWDRSRSPRYSNKGERQGEQRNPENETGTRSTKPIHFRDM